MFIIKNIRKLFLGLFVAFVAVVLFPKQVTLEPIDLGFLKIDLGGIMLNNLLQSYTFWFIGGFVSCGFVFSWIYYVYDKVLAKNSYKRETLELLSDCSTILDEQLLKIAHQQDLALKHHNDFESRFDKVLSIPEISNNNSLKMEIRNAKNRFLSVTNHAQSVCHDKERISRYTQNSITTVYLFQKESKSIIVQFNEHKTEISKLCQHSLLGFRY